MKRPQSSKVVSSDSSSESDDEVEWKSRPKRVKRVQSSSDGSSESEPEEGELSSEVEEEDDGLDEDLMGDDADRKRLAQMTEKEREEELFKRAEMREAMRARRSVKEKLREEKRRRQQLIQRQNQKNEAQDSDVKEKSKSRRDSTAAGSRAAAGTSRQKALEEKRNGANKFAQLIERRKAKLKTSEIFSDEDESSSSSSDSDSDDDDFLKKNEKENLSKEKGVSSDGRQSKSHRSRDSDDSSVSSSSLPRRRRQRKRSVSSSGSSRGKSDSRSSSPSGSEEGECQRSDGSGDEVGLTWSKSSSSRKNALIESLDELLRIKLSRFKMEKWVHMPFFKELVKGCYVRVGIGNREGIAIYRIAEIEDVVETGKIYDLGPTRTNRGLILRHGEDRQMFRLCFLSNQDFSQTEWEKWLASMVAANLTLPTRSFVERKEQEIIHAMNHRIENDAELDRILDEKKRFRRGPTNYTVQKIELLKQRQLAESQGDTSKVAKLTLEMTDLESEASEKERRRTSAIKSITYINERNRAQNLKLAEEASKREFEELEEMQRNGQQDPFSRLQTRPVLFGKKRSVQQPQVSNDKKEGSSHPTQQGQPEKSSQCGTISTGQQKDNLDVAETTNRDGTVGDVFSIHNFDINIDLDVPLSAPLPPSVPVNSSGPGVISLTSTDTVNSGSSLVGSRRGLNLEEYKKRRGLI